MCNFLIIKGLPCQLRCHVIVLLNIQAKKKKKKKKNLTEVNGETNNAHILNCKDQ